MAEPVYCVPSEVLFRNYASTPGPLTRNLLLKNTTNAQLQTVISYPFSPSFRLHIPPEQKAELRSNPPHVVLELGPNSTGRVILELKPPEASADGSGPLGGHFQDELVVLFGGVRQLVVPMRAVHHGLEGTPAQQSALLTRLAYWPGQQELDARSAAFTDDVTATYPGITPAPPAHVPPPPAPTLPLTQQQQQPAGRPGAGGVGGGPDPADPLAAAFLGMQPGADPQHQQQQAPAALVGSRSGAPPPMAPPRQAVELPPEGFSQADAAEAAAGAGPDAGQAGGGLSEYGDLIEEDDDAVKRPFVLTKTVKVQGRVAVAVPSGDAAALAASASGALPPAAAGHGISGGRGGAAPVGTAAAAASLPVGDPLSRTSSGSGSVGIGGGGGMRPGSAGKAVFVLNGKLYDARGNEVDPAAAAVGPGGGVMVVDCGEVTTPRMSRPSSASNASAAAAAGAGTPPRLAAPPLAPLAVGSPGPGSSATGGRGVGALAPLKHGGIPVAAALRPGSATGAAAFMGGSPGPLRQPPAPSSAAASAPPPADDPLRAAALAAAMRELGITDLPTPSSSGRPGAAALPQPHPAAAHAQAGGQPDWPRLQARGPQPPLPANGNMPSYVQYGLPPNYRPSSGRRPGSAKPPPARSAPAAAPAAGTGDDGEALLDYDMDDEDRSRYDDGDFEARLQQQVESNVLKTAGPVAAPPVARTAAPGANKAAPGAYLPPRAGAATSGGLGASPAAATAAAVAAGSRLGKATAAMAAASAGGGGGAAARKGAAAASDQDYPEESEFELQLQRQIDDANAFSAGGGGGGGGGLGAVRAAKGGGGGGAGWRGPSGSNSTTGMGAAAAGAPGLKRSNSAASAGSGGTPPSSVAAGAQGAGPRRVSADSSPASKGGVPVAVRISAGSAPRPHAGAVAASGSPARPPPAPAATAAGARASPARAAAAGAANASPAKASDVQRLKANWDALG
ncbi:hypothetical protein CHLRE_10g447735v5 [Chlamydomonas reinhardtii]|uniref:Uncharacterized protein n=1 Tax=Chlamydomonas reinhardtii TaxID=3055 RepID=A0A2K3DAY4_CHLRE|nr:uncharacterized protein CHLRE_10g447735v5 [Chlamydomonas reinhardtii]PNW77696.1 hypothetical protein CHLRE_10g447735v5 [Chlamydomonas reinhardtii]